MQYRSFLQQLQSGGRFYAQRGADYGGFGTTGSSGFCLSLCGVVGVFADEEFLDKKGTPLETNLRFVANYICAVLNLPMVDLDSVISAVTDKVRSRKSVLEDLSF